MADKPFFHELTEGQIEGLIFQGYNWERVMQEYQ